MTVNFYVKNSRVTQHDHVREDATTFTVVLAHERDGSAVTFVVDPLSAAEALAIGDAIRAAALKHMPAPEPAAVEV